MFPIVCHDKLNGASTGGRYGWVLRAKVEPRCFRGTGLIDLATLALTHVLMAVALWRLMWREELDREKTAPKPSKPWLKSRDKGTT